jgi:membrane protein
MRRLWTVLTDAAAGFVSDNCLSRGAAIAYYTVFSLAPLLVIAIAIAGLVFGDEAARGAVADQIQGLVGREAAEAVQGMIRGAADTGHGGLATAIGFFTLFLTASGTFSELQGALNAVWKTEAPAEGGGTVQVVSRFLRAKAAAIGLVAATGFLLLVSLMVSAVVSALGAWLGNVMPGMRVLAMALNLVLSVGLIAALLAAIYKVLPDRHIAWRDVIVGALVTSVLFAIGKSLIGWYIGSGAIATSFGAAGSLAVLLLWVYYSAQIFLFGAEFTRAWAGILAEQPNPRLARSGASPAATSERPRTKKPGLSLGRLAGAVSVGALLARLRRKSG